MNSSWWSDAFIRGMLTWCKSAVEVPPGALKAAHFRKRTSACWSGHAWSSGRITVSIGSAARFHSPVKWAGYKLACLPSDGSGYLKIADQLEALVIVTAHELGHIADRARGGDWKRGAEAAADARARFVLRKFRAERDTLEREWSEQPAARPEPPRQGLLELRARKAAAYLTRWERKLKLANTKVRKYRHQVARYEKIAAVKAAEPCPPS